MQLLRTRPDDRLFPGEGAVRSPVALCRRCGSVLDGPRENPRTQKLGRKCADCLSWQHLPPRDQLTHQVRRAARRFP